MRFTSFFLLLLSALAFAPVPALPQASTDDVARGSTMRTLQAARAVEEIRIDGRLDEAVWNVADAATDFTQSYPDPGAPPSQRTEARVVLGGDALYVAMRMYDTHPDSIAAQLARRDATGLYSDWAHVMIDSRHDRRTAFRFSVNPRGVKRDVYHFDDGNEDGSWDAVWEVATTVDSLGWAAEFRIPLSQLRFGSQDGDVWGLQLMRDIARYGERDSWSPWTQEEPGFVSRFGELHGLEGVRPPRRLELLPYTTARVTRAPGSADNPFYEPNAARAAAGADLKAGLPLGLTLDATINPDFGQVEVDPAVVNLSAFETFFPERRPFFTEGVDAFTFGSVHTFNSYNIEEYFYSRRIGRAPRRRLGGPDYRYVDAPEQTTILGAAKVSGKTPGGWSVGVMDAVTSREEARFVGADGERGTATVEPLSNYFVGRLRRDLRGGGTVVGGIVTATHRDLADSVLVPVLHSSAYLGGVDFEHSWADRVWTLSGYLAASQVNGSAEAVALTQGLPARYYARPDAEYVELDPARTSLRGHMAEIALQRAGSWDLSLDYKETSPGFEINDLGFQGRTDYRSFTTFLGRRVSEPGRIFRNHSYYGYSYHAWNFGGDQILDGYSVGANGTFTNFWFAGFNLGYRPEYLNDRLTRGGPLAGVPSQWEASFNAGSDSRKQVSGSGSVSYIRDDLGGSSRSANLSLDLRPSSFLRLSLGPGLVRTRDRQQFVFSFADPLASATFGRRYVFADLDQTTLALETRLDWTFTPELSLQLYAQPFVSAVDYSSFKEFSEPRTVDFDVYGSDRGAICRYEADGGTYALAPTGSRACPAAPPAGNDPDFRVRFGDPNFTFRSLRGNAVLRWEYRPGSALFFVWQQNRATDVSSGTLDLDRDAGAIFREPATNVFLIKATYWIGL